MPRGHTVPSNEISSVGIDNVVWTIEMDNVLINVMLDKYRLGNRPNGTWTTLAFDNMVQVLSSTFGPHIKKHNIKNRMKTLKKIFGECKDLFNGLSGFAWNPTTHMFEAKDVVWEDLIKSKPEARKWRHTPILNYDILYELYGNQRATGEYAESAREKVARWKREGTSSQFDLNDSMENFLMLDSEGMWAHDVHQNDNINSPDFVPSINSQGTTSSRGTKRKAPMIEMLASPYEKLNTSFDRVLNVLERGNNIVERSVAVFEKSLTIFERSLAIFESGRTHCYKTEEIYAKLEMLGAQRPFLYSAYNYLCSNSSQARSFFGLPRNMWLEWLMGVMGSI